MLHATPRENHRETHGFHGMPPRGGNDAAGGVPHLDVPPLPAPRVPTADPDIYEMARKFEQTFAELTPPEEIRPTGRDELLFEFRDDIAETSKPAAPALPLYSRDARREPVLAQPRPRHDAAAETKTSAEMHSSPKAPSRERARWASTALILCTAVALAVGAAVGFIAAKRAPSGGAVSPVAAPAGSGVLRLDYELKRPPSGAQRRKP